MSRVHYLVTPAHRLLMVCLNHPQPAWSLAFYRNFDHENIAFSHFLGECWAKPCCFEGSKCRQKSHGVFAALATCNVEVPAPCSLWFIWAVTKTFFFCSMFGIVLASYIGIHCKDPNDRRCQNVRPKLAKKTLVRKKCSRLPRPSQSQHLEDVVANLFCFLKISWTGHLQSQAGQWSTHSTGLKARIWWRFGEYIGSREARFIQSIFILDY